MPRNPIESLLPLFLPLLANYADKALPDGPKRLLYVNLLALGTEGAELLAKTQTTLDEAAFAALLAEAREEADEAGLTDLASDLDAFVRLTA